MQSGLRPLQVFLQELMLEQPHLGSGVEQQQQQWPKLCRVEYVWNTSNPSTSKVYVCLDKWSTCIKHTVTTGPEQWQPSSSQPAWVGRKFTSVLSFSYVSADLVLKSFSARECSKSALVLILSAGTIFTGLLGWRWFGLFKFAVVVRAFCGGEWEERRCLWRHWWWRRGWLCRR